VGLVKDWTGKDKAKDLNLVLKDKDKDKDKELRNSWQRRLLTQWVGLSPVRVTAARWKTSVSVAGLSAALSHYRSTVHSRPSASTLVMTRHTTY